MHWEGLAAIRPPHASQRHAMCVDAATAGCRHLCAGRKHPAQTLPPTMAAAPPAMRSTGDDCGLAGRPITPGAQILTLQHQGSSPGRPASSHQTRPAPARSAGAQAHRHRHQRSQLRTLPNNRSQAARGCAHPLGCCSQARSLLQLRAWLDRSVDAAAPLQPPPAPPAAASPAAPPATLAAGGSTAGRPQPCGASPPHGTAMATRCCTA